jgi:hypothetical protein
MPDPVTSLHYTSNGNFVNGQYAPGADGFNLADVTSASELSELPSGVKALVWLGMTDGVTAAFMSAVESFAGSSQVYGFYLADEPAPSATTAANFKAESDWIHANFPGAKTFIIEQDSSSELTPSFYYTPANTDIDLFGLDPYPVNSGLPGGFDLGIIPLAVQAAEAAGIPRQDLAPVYQAFGGGGYSQWAVPTPAQEQQILSTWGSVLPNPVFDYAYSWGAQVGDTALSNDPGLQRVFAAHNGPPAAGSTPPAAPTIPYGVVNSNDSVTLTGTAPAGSTVRVWDGGANPLGTATASSSFVWSFTTADLSPGAYAFTATDTTSAGTSAKSSALNVTVPTAAASTTSSSAGSTTSLPAAPTIPYGVVNTNHSVTLTGTAPAGATVTVWDGGANPLGTATANSAFVWSFTTADLSAGSYAFTATDTTAAGTSVKSSALAVTVPLSAAPAIAAGAASAAAQQPAAAVGGGEVVTAGSGPETFAYTSVSQSTGPSYDIIADANWSLDKFHLSGSPVALLDPHVYSGSLSTASFDSDLTGAIGASHLSADAAILFTPSAGTLAGNTFLIVDENGAPGYQAGKDFVFNITGAKGTLTTANFI